MAMLNPGVMRTGIMRSGVMASGIMVDNSSPTPPFTPASLSGLVGWYDAQDAATVTQASGAVSAWKDKSASAIDVSQSDSASQPVYSATGFSGVLPAITFTGAQGLMNADAFADSLGAFTVFGAVNVVALSDTFPCIFLLGSASTLGSLYVNEGDGLADFFTQFGTPTDAFSNISIAGSAVQFCLKRDAAGKVTFRFDGADDTSSTTITPATLTMTNAGTYIGNDGFANGANGQIGELIFYDRLLSSAEIGQIESYLSARWSL